MKSRFAVNLLANLFNFILGIAIGLFFTPYLIRHLGVAVFGLLSLASSFINYLGLLTTAITTPLGRYMMLAFSRGDIVLANKTFNTALWATLAILAFAAIPLFLFAHFGLGWVSLPPGCHGQFEFLVLCTIIIFYTTTVGAIFTISAYCRNRLELISAVGFLGNIVRVACVLAMFALWAPAVWMVGLGMLLSSGAALYFSFAIWRKLTPELNLKYSWLEFGLLKDMMGFGGWTFINQIGSVLYLSIDLIVVNYLFGSEASGRYATVLVFSGLLRNVGGIVSGVFSPKIMDLYAQNRTSELINYARSSVKFVGMFMAFPIAMICGLSQPLLSVWLGKDFAAYSPLLSLLTIHLCVNLAVLPLFNLQNATGHVRLPGLLTCAMGVINLYLGILLAGPLGWGMYGVAAAGAIMLTLKNAVFTPLYAAHFMRVPLHRFFKEILITVTATIGIAGLSFVGGRFLHLHGWWQLIGFGTGLGAVWCLAAYTVLLTVDERLHLKRMLPLNLARTLRLAGA